MLAGRLETDCETRRKSRLTPRTLDLVLRFMEITQSETKAGEKVNNLLDM